MKILKFEIPEKECFSLDMPESAQILSFQIQNGKPIISVMADTKKKKAQVNFEIFKANEEIPEKEAGLISFHVGTIHEEENDIYLFQIAKVAQVKE